MRLIIKSRIVILVFSLIFGFAPFTLKADQQHQDVSWILTGDSPTLDKSTNYLARGNIRAGIRYARQALQRSRSPYREVIANHNLCLGLRLEQQFDSAAAYCSAAENISIPDAGLVEIHRGFFKITAREGNATVKFQTLISDNLTLFKDIKVAGSR